MILDLSGPQDKWAELESSVTWDWAVWLTQVSEPRTSRACQCKQLQLPSLHKTDAFIREDTEAVQNTKWCIVKKKKEQISLLLSCIKWVFSGLVNVIFGSWRALKLMLYKDNRVPFWLTKVLFRWLRWNPPFCVRLMHSLRSWNWDVYMLA